MKYYIDTEFIELPERTITKVPFGTGSVVVDKTKLETVVLPATIILISIGIVDERGREYYAVNTEADISEASPWVKENVLEKIPEYHKSYKDLRAYQFGKDYVHPTLGKPQEKKTLQEIRKELLFWCGQENNIPEECEFWGYYCDYDWVVFCWLFGTMMQLPKGFPKYCKDLKQLMDSYTLLDKEWKQVVCPDPVGEHNALVDAKWNKQLHRAIAQSILISNTAGNNLP